MKEDYRKKDYGSDNRLYFRLECTFLSVQTEVKSDSIYVIGQFIYDDEIVHIHFDPLLWHEDDFNFPKNSEVEILFALTAHDGSLVNYPVKVELAS